MDEIRWFTVFCKSSKLVAWWYSELIERNSIGIVDHDKEGRERLVICDVCDRKLQVTLLAAL
jgi:hypothetical protein